MFLLRRYEYPDEVKITQPSFKREKNEATQKNKKSSSLLSLQQNTKLANDAMRRGRERWNEMLKFFTFPSLLYFNNRKSGFPLIVIMSVHEVLRILIYGFPHPTCMIPVRFPWLRCLCSLLFTLLISDSQNVMWIVFCCHLTIVRSGCVAVVSCHVALRFSFASSSNSEQLFLAFFGLVFYFFFRVLVNNTFATPVLG